MLRETFTENGKVRGIPAADPRITAYKGIPFAAPPVGELRWRAPQPAKNWDGVLECFKFAPISMQEIPGEDPNAFYSKEWHVDPEIPMSEDCLYLNVWTPAKKADEKLPVMVWIFGGGMANGYPAEMEFDGERIARRGVILVSVNYRVNSFGFLTHPELTQAAKETGEVAGNFGLLDQRAGIEWVKRNIANFGGDPDNITVFGQSAGGRSSWAHVCSPMNKGLFKRAIPQSGAIADDFARYPTLEASHERGIKFLEKLGVSTIEEARKIDAKTLINKTLECSREIRWSPVLDGQFLVMDPIDAFKVGAYNDVAIMTGNTAGEGKMMVPTSVEGFENFVKRMYGDDAEYILEKANVKTDEDVLKAFDTPDFNRFEVGNKYVAWKNAKHGRTPIYCYRFNPEIPGDNAGSFHSSDLWFVFESLAKCWRPFVGKHYDLARQMCNYWTNFAKCGDPNGLDADGTPMETWRPVTEDDINVIYFGDTVKMEDCGPTELMMHFMEQIDK